MNVLNVPTILIARTDADAAQLITSDCDPADQPFLSDSRTAEGFFTFRGGIEAAIARGLAFAPYADMIWCETSEPNLTALCQRDSKRVLWQAAGLQLLALV